MENNKEEERIEELLMGKEYIEKKEQEKSTSFQKWFNFFNKKLIAKQENNGYKIISEGCPAELEEGVWESKRNGWKPIGGILTKDGLFLQAMIKENSCTK